MQIQLMSEGDLFVTFARLKTASLQGISIYKQRDGFLLCPLQALAQVDHEQVRNM